MNQYKEETHTHQRQRQIRITWTDLGWCAFIGFKWAYLHRFHDYFAYLFKLSLLQIYNALVSWIQLFDFIFQNIWARIKCAEFRFNSLLILDWDLMHLLNIHTHTHIRHIGYECNQFDKSKELPWQIDFAMYPNRLNFRYLLWSTFKQSQISSLNGFWLAFSSCTLYFADLVDRTKWQRSVDKSNQIISSHFPKI